MTKFNECKFYSCDPDAEILNATTPEEALSEYIENSFDTKEELVEMLSEFPNLTVYGFNPIKKNLDKFDRVIESSLDNVLGNFEEEYCHECQYEHEAGESELREIQKKAFTVIKEAYGKVFDMIPVTNCEQIASKTYEYDELLGVFRDELFVESWT